MDRTRYLLGALRAMDLTYRMGGNPLLLSLLLSALASTAPAQSFQPGPLRSNGPSFPTSEAAPLGPGTQRGMIAPQVLIAPGAQSAVTGQSTTDGQFAPVGGPNMANRPEHPTAVLRVPDVRTVPGSNDFLPVANRQTQPSFVAVMGSVKNPGAYAATGRTITELLEGAGGLTPEATRNLRIQRGTRGSQKVFWTPQMQFEIWPGDIIIAEGNKRGVNNSRSLLGDNQNVTGVVKGRHLSTEHPQARINIVAVGLMTRPVVLSIPTDDARVAGLLKWLNQSVRGSVTIVSASGVPQVVDVERKPQIALTENCIVQFEPGRVDPTVLPRLPDVLTPASGIISAGDERASPAETLLPNLDRPASDNDQSKPRTSNKVVEILEPPEVTTDKIRAAPVEVAQVPKPEFNLVPAPRDIPANAAGDAGTPVKAMPGLPSLPEPTAEETTIGEGPSIPSVDIRPRREIRTPSAPQPGMVKPASSSDRAKAESKSAESTDRAEQNGSAVVPNVSLPVLFVGSSGLFMLLLTTLSYLAQRRGEAKAAQKTDIEVAGASRSAVAELKQSAAAAKKAFAASASGTAAGRSGSTAAEVRPVPPPHSVSNPPLDVTRLEALINNQCLIVEEPLDIPPQTRLYGRPVEQQPHRLDTAEAVPAPHFHSARSADAPSERQKKAVRVDKPHAASQGLLDRVLSTVQGDVR